MTQFDAILSHVVCITGVTRDELLSASRRWRISRARELLYHVLHEYGGMTWVEVAASMNRNSHDGPLRCAAKFQGRVFTSVEALEAATKEARAAR